MMCAQNGQIKKVFTKGFYKKLPWHAKWFLKRKYHEYFLFKMASRESIFESIWRNNYWGSSESVSGPGSTLEYTQAVRRHLPIIFKMYKVKSVFDAPCGDLNWMKEVIQNSDINYIGADIVRGIIKKNISSYQNTRIQFQVLDITSQAFPNADLWLCRDVLFHLCYQDILNALEQFAESNIPYFLTNTHKNADNGFQNENISTGHFRLIDLFQFPFNFPKEACYRFDDYIEPQPPREMCLFTRDQVLEVLPLLKANLKN